MIRVLLIGAVIALLVSGCRNEGAGSEQHQVGSASLRLNHVVAGPPLYIEGSIWHVQVVDFDGAAVLDRKLADKSVSVSLEPGRYKVESEELACNGNCRRLAEPSDGCSAELTAESGQELAATVTLRPGHGCKMAIVKSART